MHNLICRACSCNLSSPLLTPPPPYILINKIVFLSKNSLSGLLYSWGCQRSDHPHQSSWTQIFVPPASINTWMSVSVWPFFQTVPSSAFCKKAMCRSRPLAWRRQLNSFEISDSEPGPCHPLCWIRVTFTIHLFMPWLTIQIKFLSLLVKSRHKWELPFLNKRPCSETEFLLPGARQNNQEGQQMIHLPALSIKNCS